MSQGKVKQENEYASTSSKDSHRNLMTPEDVAYEFSVDRRTVLRWAREGKLGHVKLSHKNLRFTESQVQEFIQSKSVANPNVIDNARPRQLTSRPIKKEGGEKSTGDSARAIRKELRSWQL